MKTNGRAGCVDGMERSVEDVVHCEEQLRSSLHSDDKSKLRARLLLLQKEYIKTVQKLQRAERGEAVKRHAKSTSCQQRHQVQRAPETSLHPGPDLADRTAHQGLNGDMTDSDNSQSSQVDRFPPPDDDVGTPITDRTLNSPRDQRHAAYLRLRSRSSRLRWERRCKDSEAQRSSDCNKQEHSHKTETAAGNADQVRDKMREIEIVNESEDLFSSSDSASLLLKHWNNHGQSCAMERKGTKREEGQDCHSDSNGSPLNSGKKVMERREEDGGSSPQMPGSLCDERDVKGTELNVTTETPKCLDHSVEIKKEVTETTRGRPDREDEGLLSSCTLVDGLMFPAEYYVRTTRRMTSSQSQPDMQAVILSQLSGRQYRAVMASRRRTQPVTRSDQNPHATDSPSPAPPSSLPQVGGEVARRGSKGNRDVCSSVSGCPARLVKGGKRGKSQGKKRNLTSRGSIHLDDHRPGAGEASEDTQPTNTWCSSSPSTPTEGLRPTSTPTTNALPSAGAPGLESSPAPASVEKVYPIFLKTSNQTSSASGNRGSWQSLLLPSPPPSSQTSLFPHPLLGDLERFHVHQDFLLPDEQFASLKLHKLCQVALESGVEHLTSPSCNTRSSTRRAVMGVCDAAVPPPLSLSLTPTMAKSTWCSGEKQAATLPERPETTMPLDQTCTKLAETQQSLADDGDLSEKDAGDLSIGGRKEVCTLGEEILNSQICVTCSEAPAGEVSEDRVRDLIEPQIEMFPIASAESQTDCSAAFHNMEEQTPTKTQREVKASAQTSAESPQIPSQCPATNQISEHGDLEEHSMTPPSTETPRRNHHRPPPRHAVDSQLLLSPTLSSPLCPFLTPRLLPSAVAPTSPPLPSLGLTPFGASPALPLTSSPRAPSLSLPPPHSPSTQALSPPELSPCRTPKSLPPSLPPVSPSARTRGKSGRVETEAAVRCTHTLKSPAGGRLVDACCLLGPDGDLCVAAAGKWAVCVWNQTSTSDWSLTHTWTFTEPVINVFPVPDAAGLLCVTLGQLEIREVRILSCSSLLQMLLCVGVIQAAMGVAGSRVVTSSHIASGSTLEVFTPSSDGSSPSRQSLVSPGVCVTALAGVDGQPEALLGTDDAGCLFVWNLSSGQLLQRIVLAEALSHTACLRGHSHKGVLFVLLQHHFLSSIEDGGEGSKGKDDMFQLGKEEDEGKRDTLFTTVATNPLNGKSVQVAQLHAPKTWTGRLCEADANGLRVVGLSQNGCLCLWDFGSHGDPHMLPAPESEGWQLARWGGGDTLVTGHHNGDVLLYSYSVT